MKEEKKRSESRDKPDSFFRRRYEEEETPYREVCEHFSGEHSIYTSRWFKNSSKCQ